MHFDRTGELDILKTEAESAKEQGHPVINCFDGEYAFLSNFYETPVIYDGITYRNSEAAFQAQKCVERKHEFTDITAYAAKKLGRKVTMRSDWNSMRIRIMHDIVYSKFSGNPELKEKLIATDGYELIEGNYWGDRFWGVCHGTGKNHLGRILMQVRSELREPQTL